MTTLHVVSVFTDDVGDHGNALGVFLDGGDVAVEDRQAVAARLGFSETVFVDDPVAGSVDIYTPAATLPFAGHPLVGTSWLLAREREPVAVLRPPAGDVPTWHEGDRTWIRGRSEWVPDMECREFPSPADVDALTSAPDALGFVDCWAWIDEERGLVRSRVFASDVGIDEDEATGAAAVRLATLLGRAVRIHQGQGSILLARPGDDGTAEVGGTTRFVGHRVDPGR